MDKAEVMAGQSGQMRLLLLMVLITAAIVIPVGVGAVPIFMKGINSISTQMLDIAGGEGDLTKEVTTTSNVVETVKLAGTFNQFVIGLRAASARSPPVPTNRHAASVKSHSTSQSCPN